MSVDLTATSHPVSIAPLLREFIGLTHADSHEIEAARKLISQNELSYSQRSLFLVLMKAKFYELSTQETELLERVMVDLESLKLSEHTVSIEPLLRDLLEHSRAGAEEIADAIALIFDNKLSIAHCSLLLGLLAYIEKDKEPSVLARTAEKMRLVAAQVDRDGLRTAVIKAQKAKGEYEGGLCDIVGTGGDGHSTFNVSTTASIVASSYLLLSKHGNRASSSTSGSADLLQAIRPKGPNIEAVAAQNLPSVYEKSSYAFLFAPKFHPGMKHVASIRKELGIRTIFNVLGPLTNPVEGDIEARVVGVAEKGMGFIFAEALRIGGAKKAMVVCGEENLDEISCAGKTHCWRVFENESKVAIEKFELEPADFGLSPQPLSKVAGGNMPQENAAILVDLLENKMRRDDPILQFVLINTAALFAIAGICEDSKRTSPRNITEQIIRERGPGGQRWKEGVRLARKAIETGKALRSLHAYIEATHNCQD